MNVNVNPGLTSYQERQHANNVLRSNLLLARLVYVHGKKRKDRTRYLPSLIYQNPIEFGFAEAKRRALKRKPQILSIITACADSYGVSVRDIVGPRRLVPLVRPRQVAFYLAREMTNLSWTSIAKNFGGRDHTTGIYAHQKIQSLMDTDADLRARINGIRVMITGDE